jgi:hypothetical protein
MKPVGDLSAALDLLGDVDRLQSTGIRRRYET